MGDRASEGECGVDGCEGGEVSLNGDMRPDQRSVWEWYGWQAGVWSRGVDMQSQMGYVT